jgi:hypothetical protein
MDLTERGGIARTNSEAEREKTPGDSKVVDAPDSRSFIVMIAATLVATVLVLGMMWMNNLRYDGASSRPVAEQQQRE